MRNNGKANEGKGKQDVTAVIQARMQSKRLPGKALLDLCGKPLLAHVIERTKLIENVNKVVVATSEGDENRQIMDLAESMGVFSLAGSMENVLERYYTAAEKYGGDLILRVTGDNPFTDVEYASMVLEIAMESGADYCALSNMPLGTAVEVIKRGTLEEAYKMGVEPYHKEHVTSYIREHPELFIIERPPVNLGPKFKDLRLTVDTPDDYKLARILCENLYKGEPFPLRDIFDYIEKNPEVITINREIVQRTQFHSEK